MTYKNKSTRKCLIGGAVGINEESEVAGTLN